MLGAAIVCAKVGSLPKVAQTIVFSGEP